MKLLTTLNPENASEEEIANFKTREAARAVVFDKDNNIALLNVTNCGYHKLPGGGVEAGEDALAALKRECKEEIGCDIEVTGEIGEVVEYRKMFNIKQTSYCYLAKVVGEKGKPAFMPDEIEDGFEVQWVSLEKAKRLLSADDPQDKKGKLYFIPRETTILDAVKDVV